MNSDMRATGGADPVPANERPFAAMGQVRQGRLLLGIVLFIVAVGYTYAAFQIPFNSLARPGAGVFPRLVGIATAVIALILIAESLFSREKTEALDLPTGTKRKLVLIFFGGTVAFVILLPILGQYLAGALYMTAMVKFLGTGPWWKAVLYGVGFATVIAFAFIRLLDVNLPPGILIPS